MTSKERVRVSLAHREADRLPVDFGSTTETGMHVSCIENLRRFYGLPDVPVKMHEPYQCLGLIEDDLAEIIGTDVEGVASDVTWFGFKNGNWKEWKAPWGQVVLVAGDFNTTVDGKGNTYIYPQGDVSAPASGVMPSSGFFFDEIIRQGPLPADDRDLKLEDNLEEFGPVSDEDLRTIKTAADSANRKGKAGICVLGGTGIGDIANVPGPAIKYPKGIRDITEWYISTISRRDFVNNIFEKQIDTALENLQKLYDTVGNTIDILFTCGTDFGTQDGSFCSPQTFRELYLPHYRRTNDWVHAHTGWKIMKHSCGSIPDFIPLFIECGFDIINPVQLSARGMEPEFLKREFGRDIVFWGGGVNTQWTLPFGKPEEVRREVLERCELFAKGGGFVFNAIHNVMAKTPVKNIAAMLDAVHEFNGG
ncbi:MAG: methyltransferase [Spirochaetales bacterium]|nr:MAG: methyltransferase [Spirochaetales bacterium]